MPSVEYTDNTLISEVEQRDYEHPETGETVTRKVEISMRPFEVRIWKWLERNGNYHLYGFVEVTEFGKTITSQSDPWTWVNDNYTVANGLTETIVSEMVNGVSAVENSQLDVILNFGNVSPDSAEVESEGADRFDFHIVLDNAETFDIDWLTVDFDPNRGGD